MMLNDIQLLLETAEHPIARNIFKTDEVKILVIGFKIGMLLKNHKTPFKSKLMVLYGKVEYKEDNTLNLLSVLEEQTILPDQIHSVKALEDSMCLLIQQIL